MPRKVVNWCKVNFLAAVLGCCSGYYKCSGNQINAKPNCLMDVVRWESVTSSELFLFSTLLKPIVICFLLFVCRISCFALIGGGGWIQNWNKNEKTIWISLIFENFASFFSRLIEQNQTERFPYSFRLLSKWQAKWREKQIRK